MTTTDVEAVDWIAVLRAALKEYGVEFVDWSDIRAAIARHRLSVQDVADTLGIKYSRFSTILNADDETMPRPAFADRVMDAIEQLAAERARAQ